MWRRTGQVLTGAVRDFARSWKPLALADGAFKVLALALMSPGVALLLRWMLHDASGGVVADADIARLFVTTGRGSRRWSSADRCFSRSPASRQRV